MNVIKDFKIEYFDDKEGKKKVEKLSIEMVPNSVVRDYQVLEREINEISGLWQKIKTNLEKQGDLILSKDENAKESILALQEENKNLEKEIEENGNEDFFERRFFLIYKILTKNVVKEKRLLEKDFWDDNISAIAPQEFLSEVVYKDFQSNTIAGKKKA